MSYWETPLLKLLYYSFLSKNMCIHEKIPKSIFRKWSNYELFPEYKCVTMLHATFPGDYVSDKRNNAYVFCTHYKTTTPPEA